MKLALCHLKIEHGQKQRNLERLISSVQSAAEEGAELIVTPELSLSGYGFRSTDAIRKVAESIPGVATWSVDLDHIRDKTYLPRVDYTRLFEEVKGD